MAEHYDVVVVGARCAGSPLAIDLASKGLKVCVLDRAQFPSEVPSTHMLHPSGVARLAKLGLREPLFGTGAPALNQGVFALDDVRLSFDPNIALRFEEPWLCVRRNVLDVLLVEAAGQVGADVRLKTSATGLLEEEGRICGVQTTDGVVHASLVVGADGPNSTVARLTGAKEYLATPAKRIFLWAYYEGANIDEVQAHLGRQGDIGYTAMPTDSGLFIAAIALPTRVRADIMSDLEGAFVQAINRIEEVAEVLRPATRVGPIRTMARWHGYFREATGPGWALVGDAGHFKDPTPAQGMGDAMRQAEHLASAVENGLGKGNLAASLNEWWRWRDNDAWEMYWFACDMGASGETSSLVKEMFRGLRRDPNGIEQFLRVLNHETRPSEVFTNGRGMRAVARLALSHPGALPSAVSETGRLLKEEARRRRLRRSLDSTTNPIGEGAVSLTRPKVGHERAEVGLGAK